MNISAEDSINEIMIIRGYLAFGIDDVRELSHLLEERHGIKRTPETIRAKVKDIKEGKYDTSYFDNLLDVHFPDMYAQLLKEMQTDLIELDRIATTSESESVRLNARKAHAGLAIDILNAMHKGPVLRAAKQLATKTKVMARQIIQQEAILRNKSTRNQIETNRDLYPKLVVLDENLREVQQDIDSTISDLEKTTDNSTSSKGN